MYRLTLQAPGPLFSMSAGRTAAAGFAGRLWPIGKSGGGKSGLHGDTVAANGRRGRPQGKCHRKQTAFGPPEVRVKGCGKSAPRGRRRSWQGKPHREQDQIGVAGRARKRGARSVIRPATRVGCLRRLAMGAPDEWPSRRNFGQHSASRCWAILQTEPGLQASWQLHFSKKLNGPGRHRAAYGAGGVVAGGVVSGGVVSAGVMAGGAIGSVVAAGAGGDVIVGVCMPYQMMPSTASTATAMRIVL